jgi:hypothetical protein
MPFADNDDGGLWICIQFVEIDDLIPTFIVSLSWFLRDDAKEVYSCATPNTEEGVDIPRNSHMGVLARIKPLFQRNSQGPFARSSTPRLGNDTLGMIKRERQTTFLPMLASKQRIETS